MHQEDNPLYRLATRTGQGDPAAAVALKQELAAQMTRVVRRALRGGPRSTRLTEHIRAEAGPLDQQLVAVLPLDREGLLSHVAQDLCERVVSRLQAKAFTPIPARETVGD